VPDVALDRLQLWHELLYCTVGLVSQYAVDRIQFHGEQSCLGFSYGNCKVYLLQISKIPRTAANPSASEGVPAGWRSPRVRPRSILQIGRLLDVVCSSSSQQEQRDYVNVARCVDAVEQGPLEFIYVHILDDENMTGLV
jgi:hypothetical protein